MMRSEDKIMI